MHVTWDFSEVIQENLFAANEPNELKSHVWIDIPFVCPSRELADEGRPSTIDGLREDGIPVLSMKSRVLTVQHTFLSRGEQKQSYR